MRAAVAGGRVAVSVTLGDALRVTERFRRKDFGHMDVQITIDDPKAYTKPWDVTLPLVLAADNELIEYICDENNKYFQLVPDAKR